MTSDTDRRALLVIDVQEGVVHGAFDVEGVVQRINGLIAQARAADAPVIFIQHDEDEDPDLTYGSPGWQLVSDLDFRPGDTLVRKNYRDSFAKTTLDDELSALGATTLVVTGSASDYCVQTTALRALSQGFDVTLVADAHTTGPSGPISGEDVVRFVNDHFEWLTYPDRTVSVVDAAHVSFR